nr:MAG TPA: hypothetical protein [Caudoviricetes sp.]
MNSKKHTQKARISNRGGHRFDVRLCRYVVDFFVYLSFCQKCTFRFADYNSHFGTIFVAVFYTTNLLSNL